MNINDRTLEFQRSVLSYSKRQAGHANGLQGVSQVRKKHHLKISEFQKFASKISHEISEVAQLLAKLAQLAKRKPMFSDNPIEIAEMTYLIRHKIHNIDLEMAEISQHSTSVNGSVGNNAAVQTRKHTRNVVNLLNTKMKNISGHFKNVLEARQKLEVANSDRWQKLGRDNNTNSESGSTSLTRNDSSSGGNTMVASYNNANPFMSGLLNDEATGNSNDTGQLSFPNEHSMLLVEEQQNANQQYLRERSRAVETIESTIQEVGNLFQQLAHMVQEQGDTIQRIDANMNDIDINVTGAQRELFKYFDRISSGHWMAVKVFAILFIFFIVWVLLN